MSNQPAKKTTKSRAPKKNKSVEIILPDLKDEDQNLKDVVVESVESVEPVVDSVVEPVVEPVIESVIESVDSVVEQDSDEKVSKKKKNYNTLLSEVENLKSIVDKYLEEHSEVKNDTTKLISKINKSITKIRSNVLKLNKTKTAISVPNSSGKSGFQKPVRISEEVAEFTGWDVNEPKARVDVTNFICNYIKEHKLQSTTDGRVILPDEKLTLLLKYNEEDHKKLTYASIQKLLAKHYTKI